MADTSSALTQAEVDEGKDRFNEFQTTILRLLEKIVENTKKV